MSSEIPFEKLITQINFELEKAAEPEFRERQQYYSKEPIHSLGVRTPIVRRIAQQLFPLVKQLQLDDFLAYCELILEFRSIEHRNFALAWAFKRKAELQARHFELLFSWLNKYVSNWADCDQLCCEVFGHFMMRFPEYYSELHNWANSQNRWLRRASAVILIPELRKTSSQLPLLKQLVVQLISDNDDLVQKGYGWALKVASQVKEKDTFEFIMQHRQALPRTALRYAIEKLSVAQKQAALKKDENGNS